jgi:hypothetical protein
MHIADMTQLYYSLLILTLMSPTTTRHDTRRTVLAKPKPYSRALGNVSLAGSSDISLQEALPHISITPGVVGNPGLPNYQQYKRLEAVYLASLHPRKREKALINQAMFDRIWDVIMQLGTRHESPQFRFWVRKMFTLSDPSTPFPGVGVSGEAVRPLLLHDNRPVAIQEQIYDIICYCHVRAEHGGRDKTRAAVREYYSWVPKELVSQFVKACPTCTLKKCGNPNLVAMVEQQIANGNRPPTPLENEGQDNKTVLPDIVVEVENHLATTGAQGDSEHARMTWLPSGGPLDSIQGPTIGAALDTRFFTFPSDSSGQGACPSFEFVAGAQLPPNAPSSSGPPGMSMHSHSYPMSREISLYNGLPNGWQYHGEYPDAYQAYLKGKVDAGGVTTTDVRKRAKRPRVPSVVPLRNVSQPMDCQREKENTQDGTAENMVMLPSLREAISGEVSWNPSAMMTPIQQNTQGSLPNSLQRLLVFLPVSTTAKTDIKPQYVPQIDPLLLKDENNGILTAQRPDDPLREETQTLSCPDPNSLTKLSDFKPSEHDSTENSLQPVSHVPQISISKASPIKSDTSGASLTSLEVSSTAVPPLRSFQSFQHLMDWKNCHPQHPQDNSPLCPFSPRGSSSINTGSRFSALSSDSENSAPGTGFS